MSFELLVRPVPQRLAEAIGGTVELRELTFGQIREAIRLGGEQERASESLLAASLHVDGKPIGMPALLALPGRFAGVIAQAMKECAEMHGISGDAAVADGDAAAPKP